MSLARIYTSQKSRKVWTCSKCRTELPVGSKVLSFAVGFRGVEQKRCGDKASCYPTNSELESSQVAEVYAAQESIDIDSCSNKDELDDAVQEVADACENVASEYESNEMYEINYDLQERAETVRSAGDELASWDGSLEDEPEKEDDESDEVFQTRYDEWLESAREAAQDAIDSMELP